MERLPKLNKNKDMIGTTFRILKRHAPMIKGNYDYWLAKKEMGIFKFVDYNTSNKIQRYDKQTKQWLDDDIKNYWYEAVDEKTGAKKQKNYLDEYTGFTIEFEKGTDIETYNPDAKKKERIPVKRCVIELRGNEKFGTAKGLLAAGLTAKTFGKDETQVWYKMEKDGVGYKFSIVGQVDDALLKKTQDEQPTEQQKVIDEAIRGFKQSNTSRIDMMT